MSSRTLPVADPGRLAAGRLEDGLHALRWDGRDENGLPVATGVYFLRISTEHGTEVTKSTPLSRKSWMIRLSISLAIGPP